MGPSKLNCWEFKKCGLEPGGKNVKKLGACLVAIDQTLDGINGGKCAGRCCWAFNEALGKRRDGGPAAEKSGCDGCDFYSLVAREEGIAFQTTHEILDRLLNRTFTVGLPIMVRTPSQEDVWMNLTGWKVNEFVIAQTSHVIRPPGVKDRCRIRYFKEENAYVFDAEVIAAQPVFSLVFFKYPTVIRKMPMRKSRRYKTFLPAKICFSEKKGDVASADALIIDLSEGGCRIKTGQIRAGNNFRLSYTFLDYKLEDIECEVRNIETIEGLYFVAVRFCSLSPRQIEDLKSCVELLERVLL